MSRPAAATWPPLPLHEAVAIAAKARRGDLLVVRYGGSGAQLAQVLADFPSLSGNVAVQKYRANSGRWTGKTYVRPGAILAAGGAAARLAAAVLPERELDRIAHDAAYGRTRRGGRVRV